MKIKFILNIIIFLLLLTFISSANQYYLSNPVYSDDGSQFSGILDFKGDFNPKNYEYDWTYSNSDLLKPIEKLNIQISLECNQYLHIYITDASQQRWENPYSVDDYYKERVKICSKENNSRSLSQFGLFISEDYEEPFFISLTNPSTGELIFTTENTDFLYTDIFIGFGGYFTTNDVYGFGERYHELKLGDGKFTMWPNDTSGIHEDTGEGGYNAMGIHPLGFHKTAQNSFIGLLFNNINAQDLVIKSYSIKNEEIYNDVLLEHRTIGGVIDYYITINETPDQALISLHDIIGHPTLPPFWSLGFHQCKWGYKNTKEIRDVYENYIAHELPIDTFWGDIDILQDYRIFTLNLKNFGDLPSLISEIHQKNFKFVPIVDLGFPKNDIDEFYIKGKEMNAFIKSNYTEEDLISYVWPERAVFPDFFNIEAESLWSYAMEKYYENVKYDGIWLDMNEPAMIYVDDIERGELLPEGVVFDPKKNYYENIPYIPGYRKDHPTIRGRTLSENCFSKLLPENKFLVGYNFKPLIAFLETKITNEQLIKIQKKRPFILSRSTALAHGRYGFHWLGDNESTYKDMKNGINGIFQFQIYGIPLTGDDICGFNGNSWDSLCARWMTMGAFFPFARNHNSINNNPQEPFAFGVNSKTFLSSKLALNMRYSLLRYYYTELFKVSLGEKGSFFKPLFFDYFSDENAYINPGESFMIGDAFVIYPIFSNEVGNIDVYLPKDDWSVFPTGEIIRNKSDEGGIISLTGEFNHVNIFMRGGYIFPYQDTFNKYVANSHYLKNEKSELFIIPDSESHLASGDVIFDNDDYNTLNTKNYFYTQINFIYDTLYFYNNQIMSDVYSNKDIYLSKLKYFRIKYLNENGINDMARVSWRNRKVSNVLVNYISDDIVEIDLTNLNIKFYEIDRIQFFKNN